EDPIGLAGGTNPYSFAGNDPVNLRDPTGLCAPDEELWAFYYDNDGDGQLSAGDTIIGTYCKNVGGGGGGAGRGQQGQQQCPTGLLVWPVEGHGRVTSGFSESRWHP